MTFSRALVTPIHICSTDCSKSKITYPDPRMLLLPVLHFALLIMFTEHLFNTRTANQRFSVVSLESFSRVCPANPRRVKANGPCK